MNVKIIKWLGTFALIILSVYLAFVLTYSGRIVEQELYVFTLPETSFKLNDDKKAEIIVSLYFNTKELAKEYRTKEEDIIDKITQIFSQIGSEKFLSSEGIIFLQAKLFMDLNINGIPVEKVNFKSKPLVY